MGAPDQAPQQRALSSVYDALLWGDEWVAAYAAMHSHAEDLAATVDQLSDKVFMLQTRAVILEAEALLLRYNVAEALRKGSEQAENTDSRSIIEATT